MILGVGGVARIGTTAARAGAVAALRRGSLYHSSEQWMLHFAEKGGKSREIPVRHDLEQIIFDYMKAAHIPENKDAPLFRTAYRKTGRLTANAISGSDIGHMLKRRLRAAGLPARLSPHSFRVTTITDLLEQGVCLEDVQRLPATPTRAPRASMIAGRRRSPATSSSASRFEGSPMLLHKGWVLQRSLKGEISRKAF